MNGRGFRIREGLRSGGWILVLSLVLVGAATAWRVLDALRSGGAPAVGNGRDPATYGFALSPSLIPRDEIIAGGLPRDGLPVLDLPRLYTPTQVDSLRKRHIKYLVPRDRVIGLRIGSAARAYPLCVLNWHEIVNDTLGGRAVLVTYSPFCDAAVVFDRRLRGPKEAVRNEVGTGAAASSGEPVVFGYSGLLYNSDLLMYDRRPGHRGESLWNPLIMRAVAGPAVAESLYLGVLPCEVTHWDDWKRRHPNTTVPAPDPARLERYARDPYVSYFGSPDLRFPVSPFPPVGSPPAKTPCLIVGDGRSWRVFPLQTIKDHAGTTGIWDVDAGGTRVRLEVADDPLVARAAWTQDGIAPTARSAVVLYCFWFAWYATHPGAQAVR